MISRIKSKFTSKKQSAKELSLATSESNYSSEYKFLDQLPMAAAVFDLKGNYKYVNDEYILEEKYKKDILGKNDAFYFDLIGVNADCADRRKDILTQVLKEKKTKRFTEKLQFTETNKTRYYKRYYQPVFANDNGTLKEIHLYGSDLTSVMLAQNELKYLAYHDKLTNLKNRDAFTEQLDQILAEYTEGDENLTAILFCDLDNFKLVNDSHGHDVGDKLLKEVSIRLNDVIKKSDHVYRLGGDEFTLIMKNLKNELDAGRIAENLINLLSAPYNINDHKITYISISIGIVIFPKDGQEREILIKHADTAMYNAKKRGKNTFQYYSKSITESSVKKIRIENYLRDLVYANDFENQFGIMYQPIVEKNYHGSYSVIGAEALLRWNNPHMGWISPDTFIPIAEESELIANIGDWVLYRAATDYQNLKNKIDTPFYMSVNFSAKQMRTKSAVKKVETILESTGISPHNLQLELTETNYLDEHADVNENMKTLTDMGIKLAIDDFGVGFASLSYLHKVPATTIKIDKSFIKYLSTSKQHKELVKSIIVLGENLNKDVIAEGVEQVEDLYLLDKQKCHKYQGYLFSKPLYLSDFERYMNKENLLTTIIK
jgi:diguanylate cyclase (GGDEF)-like protein